MHHRRLASTLPAAIATGAAALLLASSAHAAVTLLPADLDALPRGGAIESGQVIVKLGGGAGSSLKGTGEVKVKGSTLTLLADPEAEAWLDPTTMRGTVGIDGTLSITGSKGTAKLTNIVFAPGIEKAVTAKLGKKVITLGKLTGGKASFSHQADGLLSGASLSISAAGAKAVNKVTGNGLRSGSFGKVTMSVTTRELPLASGAAKMTLDPGILSLIQSNGYALTADAPATIDGSVITIPMTAAPSTRRRTRAACCSTASCTSRTPRPASRSISSGSAPRSVAARATSTRRSATP